MKKQLNYQQSSSESVGYQNVGYLTNDHSIRTAFKASLISRHGSSAETKIIEELGIIHGSARVDMAVVGSVIHGYEFKSDMDNLVRLPEQIKIYNAVLDKVTLVVGKNHLHEAIKLVPDWWGIIVAKSLDSASEVLFYKMREADKNPDQDSAAVASLLWKGEALKILEEMNQAEGIRSKTRKIIYQRLSEVLDEQDLGAKVREYLRTRVNWRSEQQYMLSGG